MKRDRLFSAATAAFLAFFIAYGGVRCMISGFGLGIESEPILLLTLAAAAVLCAAAFRLPHTGLPVLLLAIFSGIWLWQRGDLAHQFWQLIYRITYLYNRAYHWGYFQLVQTPWDSGVADLPLALLGVLLVMVVSWTVCRRQTILPAFLLSLLPLLSCLVVTDTVPSVPSLFLLFFGLVLLLVTSSVRSRSAPQADRLTLLAALPTALVLALLFLAVPEESYVNHSAELRESILNWFTRIPETVETSVAAISGGGADAPDSVNLSTLGRRIESTAPILEVTAETGGRIYLRGRDYDVYDGTGWYPSPTRVEDFAYSGADLGTLTITTQSRLDQLYLPYYPSDAHSLIGGQIENTQLLTQYTYRRTGFAEDLPTLLSREEYLASVNGLSYQPSETYTALPAATRAGAEALLETILTEESTATAKAEAIASYVRSQAAYDKNPSRMPADAGDFALWFLTDAEKGYCVHFATATTVLLRAAGIEARYVSGYLFRSDAGQSATLTGANAHAWAEYYEPLLGAWLVLESTPSESGGTVPPPAAQSAPEPPTTAPVLHEETTPSAPETAQTAPENSPVETSDPVGSAGISPGENRASSPIFALLGRLMLTLLLPAVLLEAQRRIRLRLRRSRQRRGDPNAQALARWQETERLARLSGEEPPETLRKLAEKAKFSRHTLTAEDLLAYETYHRAAKTRLKASPFYKKLLHKYLYALY